MPTSDILHEEPLNIVQVKAQLEKIKKRDKELNFRAEKTLDYLKDFSHLDTEKADALCADLTKLAVPRLKDSHIHKIIDIMPKTENEVKVLLQGYTITVSTENVKKIVSTVQKYLPDKK